MFTRFLGLLILATAGAVALAQVDPKTTKPKSGKDQPRETPKGPGPGAPKQPPFDPDRKGFSTDPSRDADASGRVLKYDADKRTVLIESAGESTRQTTYQLDPHVQVLIDGKPGRLADLPEGQSVRLYLNRERTTALSVQAVGPARRGVITAVDAEKRTVSVRADGETYTVPLGADAKVLVDGNTATLAELRPGAQATVWYSVDEKSAVQVMVGRGASAERERPLKEGQPREGVAPKGKGDVTGKFRGYDAKTKELTIAPAEGKGDPVKYLVDKGTEVVIDGKRGAIGTIPDNHMVRLALTADGTVIARLTAEGPVQKRKVLAVLEDRRSVQLERETDTEEVPVSPDATIVVNGRDAKISDVQPGDMATIKFAIDRRTILGIQVGVGKPEEGKIPKN